MKGGAGHTKRMVEQETPCKKNRIAPLLRCGWGKKRKATKQKRKKTSKTGSIARKKSHAHGAKKKPQSSCGSAREALRIIYLFPFAICSHFPSFPCVQGWERWSFIISTTTTTLPAQHCAYILCVTHALQPHWAGQLSPLALGLFVRQAHTHTHCVSPPLYPLFQTGRNGHFIHSHNTRGRRGYAHQQAERTSFRGEGRTTHLSTRSNIHSTHSTSSLREDRAGMMV